MAQIHAIFCPIFLFLLTFASPTQAEMASRNSKDSVLWYVMRDLKRPNSKTLAYQYLSEKGFEVFTPMKQRITICAGKKTIKQVPFIHDLLFVHTSQNALDPIVSVTPTLQYRWLRDVYREPMTVPDNDMERFIKAVRSSDEPQYFMPDEITPKMYGQKVRIIAGPLAGYEGFFTRVRGSRHKKLLVELPNFFAVGVEVDAETIQFLRTEEKK